MQSESRPIEDPVIAAAVDDMLSGIPWVDSFRVADARALMMSAYRAGHRAALEERRTMVGDSITAERLETGPMGIRIVIEIEEKQIEGEAQEAAEVRVSTEAFKPGQMSEVVGTLWISLCNAISAEVRRHGLPEFDCLAGVVPVLNPPPVSPG